MPKARISRREQLELLLMDSTITDVFVGQRELWLRLDNETAVKLRFNQSPSVETLTWEMECDIVEG